MKIHKKSKVTVSFSLFVLSSIVNEGIRAILNLFIYFFFLRDDFTRTKSTKSTKTYKKHKKPKNYKKHKTQNKQLSSS